jgi:hypothetical protein
MKQKTKEETFEKNSDTNNHDLSVSASSRYINKKFYGIPYPKIYLHVIRVSCPFCVKRGRSKVLKNIWQLRMHFVANHINDQFTQDSRNTIGKLVDYIRLQQELIEQGVLR